MVKTQEITIKTKGNCEVVNITSSVKSSENNTIGTEGFNFIYARGQHYQYDLPFIKIQELPFVFLRAEPFVDRHLDAETRRGLARLPAD